MSSSAFSLSLDKLIARRIAAFIQIICGIALLLQIWIKIFMYSLFMEQVQQLLIRHFLSVRFCEGFSNYYRRQF